MSRFSSQAVARAASALLLGAVALACVACHDCTEMGCDSETTLRFDPALSEPGDYVVVLSSEGKDYVCTNTEVEGGEWGCNQGAFPFASSDSSVHAGEAGSELGGVRLSGHLERVTVTVTKDGSELLTRAVTPAFDDHEPNGPGCGICGQGQAVVDVP